MNSTTPKKSRGRFFFRVALSVVFFVWIFHRLDLKLFLSLLKSVSLYSLGIFFLAVGMSQAIGAMRWWLLIRVAGFKVDLGLAFRSFFLGTYFNLIGLGTIGGDLVRGTIIGKQGKKLTAGLICVFADRLIGMLVLLFIGLLAVAIFGNEKMDFHALQLLCLLGLLLISGWILSPRLLLIFLPHRGYLRDKVEEALSIFMAKPGSILPIAMVSAFYHLIQISLVYYLARQLTSDATFCQVLTSVPFINILALLPVSWNGLGVRESAFLFFLSPVPLTVEQATTVSLLWFFGISFVSLSGGIIVILNDMVKKK